MSPFSVVPRKRLPSRYACASVFLALAALLLLSPGAAFAQSPSSIAGRTIQLTISSGSSPFANSGSYRFLPSALDSSYAIVPIFGAIAASTGTHSYTKTGTTTATLSMTDSVAGSLTAACTFTTASSGSYVLTGTFGGSQSGTFTLYSAASPASIAGYNITVSITSGATPFATSGSYRFLPASAGSAYNIVRISGSVVDSSGTYAYTQNSATTAYIAYDDSIVGSGFTAQLSFDTTTTGTVYLQKSGSSGYQTGTFTMTPPPVNVAPTISAQPQNRTVNTGASATFSVTASGTPSPSYQWRKDGTNLTGATSASYTIGTAFTNHAGTYSVFVSNTAGSVTSTGATLTVNPPPPAITSATSATATVGLSFTFQITASNAPTGFGATGLPEGLTVNTTSGVVSGTPTVTGNFSVTLSATNAGGTGTATLSLTVNGIAPAISAQPQSQTVTIGANVTFGVTASGTPAPAYQWRKNGTNLVGATLVTLSLTNVQAGDAGTYSVALTNIAGSVTSAGAVLTVNPPAPVITSSLSATGIVGQAFSYQITASNGPTNYGANGLPAGLTVNTSSGLVSGSPTAQGTFTVTISGTNAGGAGTAALSLTVNPPAPGFLWVNRAGGASHEFAYALAVDSATNIYVAGSFAPFGGSATFGNTTLSTSSSYDAFITKLDANGNFLWAMQVGGANSDDRAAALCVDSAGNIYLAGMFNGTLTIGGTTLTSSGSFDILVAKLDSNGNCLWAKQAGGANSDSPSALALDSAGNIIVAGRFAGTASFGTTPLTASGLDDVFIAKLDSAGNFLWAIRAGGTRTDYANSVSTDSGGNIYVAGNFESVDANFGAFFLPPAGPSDAFIAKLDGDGGFLWVKKAGSGGFDEATALSVDGFGNVYATGRFQGNATFGSNSLTSAGLDDVFIAKLDSAGNFLWAKRVGGTNTDYPSSLSVDSTGNIYIAGSFGGTASFGSSSLSSVGGSDIFVTKLDSGGNFLWAKQSGGGSADAANALGLDGAGNVFIAGQFNTTATFDNFTLTSDGNSDVFITKLGAPPAALSSPAWGRTNGFTHGASVQVGTAYRVQMSSDLANWTDLTNFTATATSAQIRDAAATNLTRRFYRVVSP